MSNQSRTRTLVHMHRMLAIAGSGAVATEACRDVGQPATIKPEPSASASVTIADPVPSTSVSAAPSDVASSSAGGIPPAMPPTASATFVQRHPPPPPPPTNTAGYLVVDMLPAPARCMGLANSSTSTGSFTFVQGGQLVLEVIVRLPSAGGFKLIGTPTAVGGAVVSQAYSNNSTQAVVRVRTPATSRSVGVSLPVSCGNAGNGTLYANATFTAASPGAPVSMSLTDY
jgi:hypothetical protein